MKAVGVTAGHWLEDSGAVAGSTQENILNLITLSSTMRYLGERGIYVVSPPGSLTVKVSLLNSYNVSCAVELHYNSADTTTAKGAEIIYLDKSSNGKRLAECALAALYRLPFIDKGRGVKTMSEIGRELFFLKATKAPAIIVEPLWMSNPQDLAELTSCNLEKIGVAIGEGILAFMK